MSNRVAQAGAAAAVADMPAPALPGPPFDWAPQILEAVDAGISDLLTRCTDLDRSTVLVLAGEFTGTVAELLTVAASITGPAPGRSTVLRGA